MAINPLIVSKSLNPNGKPNVKDVRANFMPPHHTMDTVELKTIPLPQVQKRDKYNKEIDAWTIKFVDRDPLEVVEPEAAGKAAGEALALSGLEFKEGHVRTLVTSPVHTPAGFKSNDETHVFFVVLQAAKNGGKIDHYGKVPADFKEWYDTLINAARETYDALTTPEATEARWLEHMRAMHPEVTEYVDYAVARATADLLAALEEKEEGKEAPKE